MAKPGPDAQRNDCTPSPSVVTAITRRDRPTIDPRHLAGKRNLVEQFSKSDHENPSILVRREVGPRAGDRLRPARAGSRCVAAAVLLGRFPPENVDRAPCMPRPRAAPAGRRVERHEDAEGHVTWSLFGERLSVALPPTAVRHRPQVRNGLPRSRQALRRASPCADLQLHCPEPFSPPSPDSPSAAFQPARASALQFEPPISVVALVRLRVA